MPQRTITGPIVDAGGAGIPSGELHVTPLVPAGESTDGFVVKTRKYPIVGGELAAPVVVPGSYRIDVMGETGNLLRSFTADISAATLTDITLKEVWESRADPIEVPPATIREGDNILRLAPGAGNDWQMLSRSGDDLLWRSPPPDGDMLSSIYDPQMRQADLYDRANHTGTLPISSVAGLSGALGLTEYASLCDLKLSGTGGGSCTGDVDTLRTLNTIRINNSGLSDAALLDTSDSSVQLLPGRIYYGWAEAPAGQVGAHLLKIKSTDGTIEIVGAAQIATNSASVQGLNAAMEFRIEIPAGAAARHIQVYHRCRLTQSGTGLGFAGTYPGFPKEFASITLFSRPI
jgi:hypothetical protein